MVFVRYFFAISIRSFLANGSPPVKFTFNNEDVINILVVVCKYSLSYLQQLKVILMKESNFTYTDFDRITVEQSINYYKVLKEMINDREQQ